jgi:DNA topoisomerase-2
MWIFAEDSKSIVYKNITYTPGFYRIFDEVLLNAADNYYRDNRMDIISIIINR